MHNFSTIKKLLTHANKMSKRYSMTTPILIFSIIASVIFITVSYPNGAYAKDRKREELTKDVKTSALETDKIKETELFYHTGSTSEEVTVEPEYEMISGYTSATLNVREEPSTDSEVLDMIPFNTEIEFVEYNDKWHIYFTEDGKKAYISSRYVSTEELSYTSLDVTNDERKSYMDYKAITSKRSNQYKLQNQKAYTDDNGIRMVNNRYLVALGSAYSHSVGQYLDIVLKNGTVIPCMVGDCKSNSHTKNGNQQGLDGSTAEFIVETDLISDEVKSSGDCSYVDESWNSPVVEVRLYNSNSFRY